MMQTYPMLIGADRVDSNKPIDVLNPRTEALIGQVFEGSVEQMDNALLAAKEGFSRWSKMSAAERKTRILRYADLLEQHRERLVELLMQETGKPRENAEYDFGMLTTCLRFFVEEAERIDQPVLHDPDGRFLHYMQRQPLGVTVGFLAWNFPLLNLGYKLGPVLASGCSCILKPSELTPLATLEAVYLAAEAGSDAAKFQHFQAETIVSDKGFRDMGAKQSHQTEWEKSVSEVYADASVSLNWTEELKNTCKDAGIPFFTTPYSLEVIDELDAHIPAYKIGSGDITWRDMVEKVAKQSKPYFLACGASTMDEVSKAVSWATAINPKFG